MPSSDYWLGLRARIPWAVLTGLLAGVVSGLSSHDSWSGVVVGVVATVVTAALPPSRRQRRNAATEQPSR